LKTIGFAAIAAIAALVLGFGARLSAPTAHADATANVVIGCEFLAAAIDGDLDNPTDSPGADLTEACDGLDSTDIAALASVLGDADDVLEKSDFADIDLDGNQIVDGNGSIYGWTYIIEFVNDEATTTFDVPSGLTVAAGNDLAAFSGGEDCASEADDADCSIATSASDGDGVVVAQVSDGSAAAGDTKTVTVSQETVEDDPIDIVVTGAPHNVSLSTPKSSIQTSGVSQDYKDCQNDSDVTDSSQLGDVNRTFVVAEVTDSDGTKLTRAEVTFTSNAASKANIDTDTVDADEDASDPKSYTGESVDAGAAGVASFAVICGGTATGTAKITASIDIAEDVTDTSSVELTVTGAPDAVALTASPAQIACDGTQTASVTAKVTDSAGNNVADGTVVTFSVIALGTANPIKVKTSGGSASSTITPLSVATAGVTVIVSAGDAQASILVSCSLPVPTAVPAGPTATPTGGTRGVIGPDTGNGGYLGQDGSAGIPTWTLVALALGSVALVAGGMVTRRAGK
jgi:hypothetical protein